MSEQHEEPHTGPVKTPKQFLTLVVLSFILPIFIIIVAWAFDGDRATPRRTLLHGRQCSKE